jgi:hypothetical protein
VLFLDVFDALTKSFVCGRLELARFLGFGLEHCASIRLQMTTCMSNTYRKSTLLEFCRAVDRS